MRDCQTSPRPAHAHTPPSSRVKLARRKKENKKQRASVSRSGRSGGRGRENVVANAAANPLPGAPATSCPFITPRGGQPAEPNQTPRRRQLPRIRPPPGRFHSSERVRAQRRPEENGTGKEEKKELVAVPNHLYAAAQSAHARRVTAAAANYSQLRGHILSPVPPSSSRTTCAVADTV